METGDSDDTLGDEDSNDDRRDVDSGIDEFLKSLGKDLVIPTPKTSKKVPK